MKQKIIKENIRQAADAVQMLIEHEFQNVGNEPIAGSPLDQEGLRNGKDIITDYVRHGEAGLALEHLVYMIHETGVNLPEVTRTQIAETAIAMGMDEILRTMNLDRHI